MNPRGTEQTHPVFSFNFGRESATAGTPGEPFSLRFSAVWKGPSDGADRRHWRGKEPGRTEEAFSHQAKEDGAEGESGEAAQARAPPEAGKGVPQGSGPAEAEGASQHEPEAQV